MKKTLLALLLTPVPALALQAPRDDEFKEADREAGEQDRAQQDGAPQREAAEQQAAMAADARAGYEAYLEGLRRQRDDFRQLVEKQWTDFRESSVRQWVDYSRGAESRATVDFESGKIELETLIPVEQKGQARELAEKKLAEQAKEILSQKEGGAPVLQDQVRTPEGKPVTEKNAERYVEKTLAPKIVVDDKPVIGKDGEARLRAKVTIEMVPDHLQVRAKQVRGKVEEAARKYDLDPALLMAVIHTESEFNPRARSAAPAFGLMQLMPKTAAREAYQYLYHQDKLLAPEYLYDPDNNIALGATYLHLLATRSFGGVKDGASRQALTIAAYNCGPGCVSKTVLSGRDANALSAEELRGLIKRRAPRETQEYVPRVESRVALYRKS